MLALIADALRLDPAAFSAVATRPDGLRIAAWILILAGLSQALGQSVALFANRVRPARFVLSLALGATLFAAQVVAFGVALDMASRVGFGASAPLERVVRVVGLAHAPRLLGFLVLTPYFGNAISAVLTVWTLHAMIVGARAAAGLGLGEAVALLGVAWLLTEALQRTVGRPLTAGVRWLRRVAAGAPNSARGGARR